MRTYVRIVRNTEICYQYVPCIFCVSSRLDLKIGIGYVGIENSNRLIPEKSPRFVHFVRCSSETEKRVKWMVGCNVSVCSCLLVCTWCRKRDEQERYIYVLYEYHEKRRIYMVINIRLSSNAEVAERRTDEGLDYCPGRVFLSDFQLPAISSYTPTKALVKQTPAVYLYTWYMGLKNRDGHRLCWMSPTGRNICLTHTDEQTDRQTATD